MDKKPLYEKILNILKSGNEFKIVFVGDSLTSAEWVHPNWRSVFEYILKFSFEEFKDEDWWIPEWNLKFFNYSLDGASTREFIKQVSISKQEVNPDLYIIMGTSNDIELNISVEEHVENIKEIFKIVEGKDVVYSPNIYSNENNLNNRYEEYVTKVINLEVPFNINLINGHKIFRNYPTKKIYTLDLEQQCINSKHIQKDLVHPNSLGNVYIAKMFLEELYGIEVDPERYLVSLRSDKIKYPIIN